MINLAGVQKETADSMVRAELGKAGAATFQTDAVREREVRCNVVGYFNNGRQEVFLTRAWTYWCASLSPALPYARAAALNKKWGSVIRVDGYAGGQKPSKSGVYSYHVDTQDGLDALIAEITADGGPHTGSETTSFLHGCLTEFGDSGRAMPLPLVNDKKILARFQVKALLEMGGGESGLARLEQALKLATDVLGDKSNEAHDARVRLDELYRNKILWARKSWDSNVRADKEIGRSEASIAYDETGWIWEVEHWLSQRVSNLFALGRGKHAHALKVERNRLRREFLQRVEQRLSHLRSRLVDEPDRAPYDRHLIAHTLFKQSELHQKVGEPERSREVRAEALEALRQCNEHFRGVLERKWHVSL